MPEAAEPTAAKPHVPARTTFLVREIQGERTAKQRFRRGRFHYWLGIGLMLWFPSLILSGNMMSAFPWIGDRGKARRRQRVRNPPRKWRSSRCFLPG